MKKKFSKNWKASKKPRKQKKYSANAPLHIRKIFVSANLNKALRQKYHRRSFPLVKDDIIRITRGEFKSKTGKIDTVNLNKLKVIIEGIFRIKKDGSKVAVYFNPSNLQITELNLTDKKRIESIKNGKNLEQVKSKEEKENVPKKK